MRWFHALLLLLLLVVGEAQPSSAAPYPCSEDDLWPACQLDMMCAFIFRHDGKAGVRRALSYYETRNGSLPYWPLAWAPPAGRLLCESRNNTSVVPLSQGPLSSSTQTSLDAIIRYRFLAEGSTGCPSTSNYIMVCDDETHQCTCICAPGRICAQSNEDGSTTTSNDTAAIVLTSVGLGMVLLMIIVTVWRLTGVLNTLVRLLERDAGGKLSSVTDEDSD